MDASWSRQSKGLKMYVNTGSWFSSSNTKPLSCFVANSMILVIIKAKDPQVMKNRNKMSFTRTSCIKDICFRVTVSL